MTQGQEVIQLTASWRIVRIESGDIAQLGEHCVRIAGVGGSNPPISTMKLAAREDYGNSVPL